MNKNLIVVYIISILAAFASGWGFSSLTYDKEKERYHAEKEELLQKALAEKAEIERQNRERVAKIERENEKARETERVKYEKQIAAIRKNFKPSGTVAVTGLCDKCSGSGNNLSGAGGNSEELVCYEKSELQRKIIGTLAIGAECNGIANDYNALLKVR